MGSCRSRTSPRRDLEPVSRTTPNDELQTSLRSALAALAHRPHSPPITATLTRTLAQAMAALERHDKAPSAEVIRGMFDAVDTDGDGKVQFVDFLRMQMRRGQLHQRANLPSHPRASNGAPKPAAPNHSSRSTPPEPNRSLRIAHPEPHP